jgi:hypothetical protein
MTITTIPAGVQPQANVKQLFGFGAPQLVLLLTNPTVAPGQDAPIGSLGLAQFTNGSGALYVKTGSDPTNWILK